jgi:hypothetical protein
LRAAKTPAQGVFACSAQVSQLFPMRTILLAATEAFPGALAANCSQRSPVETIWHLKRNNGLSAQVFTTYDTIADHRSKAAQTLINQPWRFISNDHCTLGHGS